MKLICEHCKQEFVSKRRKRKYCCIQCANKAISRQRSEAIEQKPEKIVWSSGGGIQSTAIAVLICNGVLPKPDYAVMIDVGYESARTIDYINRIVVPNMEKAGVKFELIRADKYTTVEIMKNGRCNLPAFRKNVDGSVSRLDTRCNGPWKQTVLKRWLKEQNVEKCVNWIGISTDEKQRAGKNTFLKWIRNEYPLINLGISRKDCVEIIKQAGWEMPIRTSCIMCPLRTKFEWLRLKVDCPEDFKKACEIEEHIRAIDENVFLSKDCRPLCEVIETE